LSVKDLETAITRLSPEELARFAEWFDEFRADEWDRQIESDAHAGRLEELGRQADDDFEAGRATPL
jgi:hypothetical protein